MSTASDRNTATGVKAGYDRPKLIVLGTVAELTRGGKGEKSDKNFGGSGT
jgi:hypothetical protein